MAILVLMPSADTCLCGYMAIAIWPYGYMAMHIWLYGYGSMVTDIYSVDIWLWLVLIYGYGHISVDA